MGRARITKVSNLKCLTNASGIFMGDNGLTTVDVSNLPNLTSILFFSNNLTSINFQNSLAISEFALQVNEFPESEVNRILIAADDSGVLSGVMRLNFGTSASPSGQGLVAKSNLEGKGWTVFTN